MPGDYVDTSFLFSLYLPDKRQGVPAQMAQTALARLEADLDDGAIEVIPYELAFVIGEARKLSNLHTWRHRHRSFDLLHVAAARRMNARRFLTFDEKQRALAEAVGLKTAL